MTTVPGRSAAAPIIAGSLVLSGVVGLLSLVWFLRDVVHYQCDFDDTGEAAPGTYFCSDGLGYILPLGSIFLAWALLSGLAVIAISGWVPQALRPRILGILSLGAPAYLSWIALESTTRLALDRLETNHSAIDFWTEPMLLFTLVVSAYAAVVAALLLVRPRRARQALYIVGGAFLVLAVLAQPATISAVLVATGIFAASFAIDHAGTAERRAPQPQ